MSVRVLFNVEARGLDAIDLLRDLCLGRHRLDQARQLAFEAIQLVLLLLQLGAMPSWKMASICVDWSALSAESFGLSIFHQNQLSCWAEAAAENESRNATANSRRQRDEIIGNLKEKRFFVEEYDRTHACVSRRRRRLRIVTLQASRSLTC